MSAPKLIEFEDGLQVFASSSMEVRFIYEEIFRDGCYDVISLPDDALVIDVGGNIGMFAVYVKRRYPDARILAFEPAGESAAVYRQNIELHGMSGVSVNEIALGSRTEAGVPFTYYPAIPGNSTRYPAQKGPAKAALSKLFSDRVAERLYKGQVMTVAVERLSSFLEPGQPIDLLKIDVEGGEVDVLRGIDAGHWPLIRQAVIEVEVEVEEDGRRLDSVCDLLTARGLRPAVGPPPPEGAAPTRIVHAIRPG